MASNSWLRVVFQQVTRHSSKIPLGDLPDIPCFCRPLAAFEIHSYILTPFTSKDIVKQMGDTNEGGLIGKER